MKQLLRLTCSSLVWLLSILILSIGVTVGGCKADSDTEQNSDADSDADSDTDTDADSDSDSDADSDSDSDADSDSDSDSDTDSDTDSDGDCAAGSYCGDMVAAHNTVRQQVSDGEFNGQPAPNSPLPNVIWDSVLAEVAYNWASTCTRDHNFEADADYEALGGTGSVGENIAAYQGNPEPTPEQIVVEFWGGEAVDYDYETAYCDGVCGDYVQLVWAETTHIGCASVDCSNNGIGWLTICNYSPKGNPVGTPYQAK